MSSWSTFRPEVSLAGSVEAVTAYARREFARMEPGTSGSDSGLKVAYLDAGVMNYVYRVESPAGTYYLKQALIKVKEHDRLGADLAGVSPARIQAEHRALTILREALPEAFRRRIPEAALFDDTNNILWTRESAPGSCSLQDALGQGRFDLRIAGAVGALLAAIHGCTLPDGFTLWPTEADDYGNWRRFLAMRTTGVLTRADLPTHAEDAVRDLAREGGAMERSATLSHLDAAPKNVIVGFDGGPVLLDFELGATVSDPAYDPGFMIGHYLLMGENSGQAPDARAAALALRDGYRAYGRPVDAQWGRRLAMYAGVTMLYRLYGSSPAPYLDPARYAAIRSAGIRLLAESGLPAHEAA